MESFVIGMRRWPLIKVKLVTKYTAIKELDNGDTSHHEFWEVFVEQETWDIGVLVKNDIVYHPLNCNYLVVPQSVINCCTIEEFFIFKRPILWLILFQNSLFVNYWSFRIEKLSVTWVQEHIDNPAIKSKNREKVWKIKLK